MSTEVVDQAGAFASSVTAGVSDLHEHSYVIDGLQYSNWDREIIEEFRQGGLTAVHVTLVIWESARETLDQVSHWYRRIRENDDALTLATSGDDIRRAKEAGKTAIILGFQNASPFEDDLGMVEVFHRLGVRIVQLTYNIQNLIGGSCYEAVDGGLTRYGRFVVEEMNRVGMIVDLSHVGDRTSREVIEHSSRPVAITHANPRSFFDHPRNKPDDVLTALAERGGVLGCAPYPHLTGGAEVTLEAWCDMVARAVDLMGVNHVAIGSDASRKWTDEYLTGWIRRGRWSHAPNYGAGSATQQGWAPWPPFFQTPADFPNLTSGLLARGLSDDDVRKVIGENWLRFFDDGFGPQESGSSGGDAG